MLHNGRLNGIDLYRKFRATCHWLAATSLNRMQAAATELQESTQGCTEEAATAAAAACGRMKWPLRGIYTGGRTEGKVLLGVTWKFGTENFQENFVDNL